MNVQTIKTRIVTAGACQLTSLLDDYLAQVDEGSVIAITSKIVSLCENNVVPISNTDREKLIIGQSDFYLPSSLSKYHHHFTIADHTLIPAAGIDESNGDNNYVLWPKNPQQVCNQIRSYLKNRFNLKRVGVIITDSTTHPLRRGTNGICLAHSGFLALNNYIGKPDLFNRPFSVSQADVAGGLSAAAVLTMGEGTECTPIALISDVDFVNFQDRDPSEQELKEVHIDLEDDLFAPFLLAVDWQQGTRQK